MCIHIVDTVSIIFIPNLFSNHYHRRCRPGGWPETVSQPASQTDSCWTAPRLPHRDWEPKYNCTNESHTESTQLTAHKNYMYFATKRSCWWRYSPPPTHSLTRRQQQHFIIFPQNTFSLSPPPPPLPNRENETTLLWWVFPLFIRAR